MAIAERVAEISKGIIDPDVVPGDNSIKCDPHPVFEPLASFRLALQRHIEGIKVLPAINQLRQIEVGEGEEVTVRNERVRLLEGPRFREEAEPIDIEFLERKDREWETRDKSVEVEYGPGPNWKDNLAKHQKTMLDNYRINEGLAEEIDYSPGSWPMLVSRRIVEPSNGHCQVEDILLGCFPKKGPIQIGLKGLWETVTTRLIATEEVEHLKF